MKVHTTLAPAARVMGKAVAHVAATDDGCAPAPEGERLTDTELIVIDAVLGLATMTSPRTPPDSVGFFLVAATEYRTVRVEPYCIDSVALSLVIAVLQTYDPADVARSPGCTVTTGGTSATDGEGDGTNGGGAGAGGGDGLSVTQPVALT
jgi:hypothetical protein